eukprot:CAMPEP_0183294642 /NCGR_PEP_ID=MMETSP0160_2-20130417/2897_1 /TAXON_ID=2839 ORGANISM="Odontella Sinensis, Strain Grunow 1884" /NCGR_SAMPLE_ID=MMETSP0160_2 /ASSEMBLY_ACC=CAM_ASM_000250 /LENGTH=341 /DNA_ID=CAMNT_0025455995 /DNA_START=59 /DNA_END=1084 /DNA_ORIENTATION=+
MKTSSSLASAAAAAAAFLSASAPFADAFVPSSLSRALVPPAFAPPLRMSADATDATDATETETETKTKFDRALIFDCDGVIIETEELHRLAYNAAFDASELKVKGGSEKVEWTVEYYDVLQNTVGGGKPKMHYHFGTTVGEYPSYVDRSTGEERDAPESEEERTALVDALQAHKTELYKDLVTQKATARPGVLELMDEAAGGPEHSGGSLFRVDEGGGDEGSGRGVGGGKTEEVGRVHIGGRRFEIETGSDDLQDRGGTAGGGPERLRGGGGSMVGLRAAKGAGMKCLITYTSSTASEDFYAEGADAKVPELASAGVTFSSIFQGGADDGEMLKGIKDPMQ